MEKASSWGLTVLLMLLMAACSSEMPLPGDPDANSAVAPRNLLPLQQVPQRIGSMWASLPHQSLTRADGEPVVDSVFSVPVGDFLATYDASTDTWVENPDIEQIDTISTYGYAVTFQNQSGFVIVSAQEGLPDLLFYTEDGNYSDAVNEAANNPGISNRSGFGVFMNLVTTWAQFKLSWSEGDDDGGWAHGSNVGYGKWRDQIVVVNNGKGVPTSWGQGDPFNRLCFDKNGNVAKTGCAATALGQLMAFYRYPSAYNGYSFPWSKMVNVTVESEGVFQPWGIDEVAHLMQFLGNSDNLQTKYGVSQSTSQPERIYFTLVNFGYAETCLFEAFTFATLKEEIDGDHPVLIYGYPKTGVGHVWVADGYFSHCRDILKDNQVVGEEKNEYVRCNWGNDGHNNGYALANVFDPNQQPINPGGIMQKTPIGGTGTTDPGIGADDTEAFCRRTKIVKGIRPKNK